MDRFFQNISLDVTRKTRIDAALSNLRYWIRNDPIQRLVVGDPFLQGSYAHQTVVRPLGPEEDYDVDVILPIDADRHRDGYREPEDILAYVRKCLARYPDYAGKAQQRRCCVRVRMSGGFHLDVVPAHVTGEGRVPYQVPNRNEEAWDSSNPPGYTRWIQTVNGGPARFHMRQATKALKRWRDLRFAKKRAPKSIVLTTLLGVFSPAGAGHGRFGRDPNPLSFMADATEAMVDALSRHSRPPTLWNPSLPEGEEDLARFWQQDDFQLFLSRLEALAGRLSKACRTKDPDNASRHLRAAFGASMTAS